MPLTFSCFCFSSNLTLVNKKAEAKVDLLQGDDELLEGFFLQVIQSDCVAKLTEIYGSIGNWKCDSNRCKDGWDL